MTPALFTVLRTALGLRLAGVVAGLFRRYTSWTPADERVFAAEASSIVQGGQRALAGLTATHVAAQASQALGRLVAPPGLPAAAMTGLRSGVAPEVPYRRPFQVVRWRLSVGDPPVRAAQVGETRARQVADMDLQQSYAESSRAAMRSLPERDRPVGWRRVPTGARSCARCLVVAVKVWPVEELSPLHGQCDCRIEPVYGDDPPDEVTLARALDAADRLTLRPGAHTGLSDVLDLISAMTPVHAELGSMLVNPRHAFMTAAELPS